MKLTPLLAASVLALSFASAHAGEKFSALEGINAEAMSADEMEAVQGKGDFFSDQFAALQASFDRVNGSLVSIQQQMMANPEIQGWYYQALGGGYQGSFEMFIVNLGQTPQGLAAMNDATNRALNGVWDAQRGFDGAITADGISRSNIATEFGNVIADTRTYVDPYTGASAVLPYTLQPGTATVYNGVLIQTDFGGNLSYINQYGYAVPLIPRF